jgi:hypothetical protein
VIRFLVPENKRDYIDKTKGKTTVGNQTAPKTQEHRPRHCSMRRPGAKAHRMQANTRATKKTGAQPKIKQGLRLSQAKRTPQAKTKHTHQHHTTHKIQTTTSDTQRHLHRGPTKCKETQAAEPSRGPPSAVHISGRMTRALEPAGSSMGSLKTSGRREHARGVAAPHHSLNTFQSLDRVI